MTNPVGQGSGTERQSAMLFPSSNEGTTSREMAPLGGFLPSKKSNGLDENLSKWSTKNPNSSNAVERITNCMNGILDLRGLQLNSLPEDLKVWSTLSTLMLPGGVENHKRIVAKCTNLQVLELEGPLERLTTKVEKLKKLVKITLPEGTQVEEKTKNKLKQQECEIIFVSKNNQATTAKPAALGEENRHQEPIAGHSIAPAAAVTPVPPVGASPVLAPPPANEPKPHEEPTAGDAAPKPKLQEDLSASAPQPVAAPVVTFEDATEEEQEAPFKEGVNGRTLGLSLITWSKKGADEAEKTNRKAVYKAILTSFVGNTAELDLSGLQLTSLPVAICKLDQLKKLNISNNQLKVLPNDFRMLPLIELKMDGNPVLEVPVEILMVIQERNVPVAVPTSKDSQNDNASTSSSDSSYPSNPGEGEPHRDTAEIPPDHRRDGLSDGKGLKTYYETALFHG